MTNIFPTPVRHAASSTVVLAVPLAAITVWGALSAGTIGNTVTLLLLNVILAVGLQSFSGNAGTISFSPMVFAAVGGYSAGLLTMPVVLKEYLDGLPGWVASVSLGLIPAVLCATAVSAVVGLVTAAIGSRLSGAPAVVATLALLLAANVVLIGWADVTRGAGGLSPIPRLTTVWIAFIGALVVIAASSLFRFSSWGIQLRASQTDATAALAGGVRVGRVRAAAWLMQSAIAGLGGALLALHLGAVTPSMFFLTATFSVVAMVIVGGLSTVSGAVTGAVVVTLLQQLMRPLEDLPLIIGPLHLDRLTGLVQISLVTVFFLVMYLRPAGIVGGRELSERLGGLRRRPTPSPALPESAAAGRKDPRDHSSEPVEQPAD